MTTPETAPDEVTQADRDAAAPFAIGHGFIDGYSYSHGHMIRTGKFDDHSLVRAFARHRLTPRQDGLREALVERVAKAIDAADPGYSIRLTGLVDGQSEYTLTVGSQVHKFECHVVALVMGHQLRLEAQARAAITSIYEVE